jgi:hypothetical protein
MGSEFMAQHVKSAESFKNRKLMPVPEPQLMTGVVDHPFLQLQQAIGNRGVQRLVQACPAFPGACPTGGACHACPGD